jgi:hypothetical protein
MGIRPGWQGLWRWWWLLGAAVLLGLTATGIGMEWSTAWWSAVAVVVAIYLGFPVTAVSLRDLGRPRDRPELDNASRTKMPVAPPAGQQASGTAEPDEPPTAGRPITNMKSGDNSWGRPSALSTGEGDGESPPTADVPVVVLSSPGSLEQPFAARREDSATVPACSRDRPWRRVGSVQFAALVQALSVALPSVDTADDAADLSGVSRHLIRKGRDTPKQRWLAVLEQALDDQVDDILCIEVLKLTNSETLRTAVSNWFREPGR